ncbi:MAG: carbohydrate ABC transporter permease [Clostridiaceae bacterium]|nr:carbohydrate ABC transporter permease [Clostridiaceae bacterium]
MKPSRQQKIFGVFNIAFFTFIALAMLIPVLFVLSRSFDAMATGLSTLLIPRKFSTFYYRLILTDKGIYRPFLNSMFITMVGTGLAVFLQAMGAYTLAKKDLPGHDFFIWMLIIPMLFGGGLIPSYLLNKALGLIDTYRILIISGLISAWNMFLIRNYYNSIPASLPESARIDGAQEFKVFLSIILPLSKPVIAAIALFEGVSYWNTYMTAVIYINSPEKYPFTVKLRQIISVQEDRRSDMQNLAGQEELLIQYLNNEGLGCAMIILSMIPIIIAYPYLQKYFTKGLMVGSIKG